MNKIIVFHFYQRNNKRNGQKKKKEKKQEMNIGLVLMKSNFWGIECFWFPAKKVFLSFLGNLFL